MTISPAEWSAAESALTAVLRMTSPADAVLSGYFRAHRALGQHDRAFVAETVFGVLRRRYGLEYDSGAATPRQLLIAYLNRVAGMSLRQLEPLLETADVQWAAAHRTSGGPRPLHVAAELPSWLTAMLGAEFSDDEILALGRTLQQPAPLDLRINSLLTNRDEVLRRFAMEGIGARPTPYSPVGVRLAGKPALNRHPLFVAGGIEVQDEGSQILCELVAPRRREMVVDFCAGAGGKTLMLGALMQSLGRLYAFDVSESRLRKFKPRLKRSGLSNVQTQLLAHENDTRVRRLAGKIDRVLVDAPCSGVGTLRRNPDLKWRVSPQSITELAAKQYAILNAASQLLKPGGRLVYATCSFLRAENDDVISQFLAGHPQWSVVPANSVLKHQGIALDTGQFLRLLPHHHDCDGFFAAVLTRQQ